MPRRLIVHLDGVAALRESAGRADPDPVAAAVLVELGDAEGIAVQLRGDRRHVQDRDARLLRQTVRRHFCLDIAPTAEMLKIALELRPDAVGLVAEVDGELGSGGGLDVMTGLGELGEVVRALHEGRIDASLAIEPDLDQVKAAHRVGARGVRILTDRFCEGGPDRAEERQRIGDSVRLASKLGLRVGVGGGLDLQRLQDLRGLAEIQDVHIGHAIVSRGLLVGLERAVAEMRAGIS
ncbi:MAG: pyridoxine 5'-phosphate synthase [Deltaproteobacteria bacterium]|nr:pyridoxine 5'-phosphate synthase [Deltaproteobacteria bacterium]MBW2413829.1 pyridoxine 5'-phosphate synthase [Deltaproteobacteria bacterium]